MKTEKAEAAERAARAAWEAAEVRASRGAARAQQAATAQKAREAWEAREAAREKAYKAWEVWQAAREIMKPPQLERKQPKTKYTPGPPELLKTAKTLLADIDKQLHGIRAENYLQHINDVSAAIAKAEGK